MELLGNLLDNAFKYCVKQVKLSVIAIAVPDSRRRGVTIVVEDDGPGIALAERQHVLQRGARLDERASGQGIGLSVVQELASLYRGSVEIDQSSLGGARITVQLLGL
jgi:two-component system sensor histidine kinase PhoQ